MCPNNLICPNDRKIYRTRRPGAPSLLAVLALTILLLPMAARAGDCPRLGGPRGLARPPIPDGLDVDPPLDSSEACPTWRWIAIKKDAAAACPVPQQAAGASWRVQPLFTAANGLLPAALAPFCVYSHDRSEPDLRFALEQNLAQLRRRGALRKIDSSCAAVGPMAAGNSTVRPLLEQNFLAQSRLLPPAKTIVPARNSAEVDSLPPRVRLALLDTQPDGVQDGPGCSPHGFSLARMAERLVCSGQEPRQCAASVVSRLALPIREFDWSDASATRFDTASGGYFGTIDQLAQAVWRELMAWADVDRSKLVLSLPVAWVGERFGGLESRVRNMPVPVQALYRALEVASCRGALVVAASGNRVLGPDIEEGPLLPAGWERRLAPDVPACRQLLASTGSRGRSTKAPADSWGPADGLSNASRRVPLVYAAGGIHGNGLPLVNARPGSEPARVAYADHAVVSLHGEGTRGTPLVDHCADSADDQPKQLRRTRDDLVSDANSHETTAVLTGSSVAATVVAATAAVVWHHRPDLDRAAVMRLIDSTGQDLGRDAGLYLGAHASKVRRVGICPALRGACDQDGLACRGLGDLSCPEIPDSPPRLSDVALACSAVDFSRAHRLDANTLDGALPGIDFCGTGALHFAKDRRAPTEPCPYRQSYGIHARPWTGPQPQSRPCSGCDIRPPPPDENDDDRTAEQGQPQGARRGANVGVMSLRIDIDADWRGGPLTSAVLDLGDTHYALGLPALDAGDCVMVENLDRKLIAAVTDRRGTPVLHFVTEHGTIEAPLFVGN